MNTEKYLNRIGLEDKDINPTEDCLRTLQRNHLLHVPFENLDIHWGRMIVLDVGAFYEKIVNAGRGGFCYELNGLFNWLLNEIGYKTRIVSARVSDGKGGFGEEFDHLAIIVSIGEGEYLVDVGFGDFTAAPLQFKLDIQQKDRNGLYCIDHGRYEYFKVLKNEKGWENEYIFVDIERDLSEFEDMCNFHQTSADSHFTRKKICSLMTENGRITLANDRFIETIDGVKTESAVSTDKEFNEILLREFGIDSAGTQATRLQRT
ncbi:MAG: acetyltransferase [Pyrinomonadaceae bacterium]|nr:acetyltransferase [Pyrinomonadaceae bacterium]